MAKEEKPPKADADPDDDFFKEHGVESDEDKSYLKAAALKEEYLEHRRKQREKPASKKGGLFGGRSRD